MLPLSCECIFSLTNFIINNPVPFQKNSNVHSDNRKNNYRLHKTIPKSYYFQKYAYYVGIKIINSLQSVPKLFRINKGHLKQHYKDT
jgi:hypothetical protein